MFEALRTFFRADAVSFAFILVYAGVLTALFALSAVYGRLVPKRERRPDASPAPLSPVQQRARGAAFGFAHAVASLNITPNQITAIGLLLMMLNCGIYLVYRDPFMFGTGLIVAYLFDTLDGVVARAQGTSSRFGGYLDAVIDRYQEVITYLAIGWVTELWLPVFLVTTGSMLTSYNKARTAIEMPIDNKGWPDLMAKPTRIFFLGAALIGGNSVPWFLPGGLWVLAAMTHLTALHRFGRAYLMLRPQGRQQDSAG